MRSDDYIKAKRDAGLHLHFHDGVCWETTRWGYCKPAIPFEEVEVNACKPSRLEAFIGYGHRVKDPNITSGNWYALIMPRETIADWSLTSSVDGKRRNSIRKGLRNNQVLPIDILSPYRDDLTAIAISTAIRNQRGFPPDYYRDHNEEWWQAILRVATYSELWGAFNEGRMIAYLSVQVAGRRAIIDGAKSMTEHMQACPNDALVFSFVDSCRARGGIEEIWYGHWSIDKPTLNDFKQSFGFESRKIPFYRKVCFGLLPMPELLSKRFAAS